jgi:urease accessory protein
VTRTALAATGRLRVEPAAGRQRMQWSQSWPVVLRRTGAEQMHLVHGAGGPLGGDDFALELTVAAGGTLRVGSAGATVVQPGAPGPARWAVRADVGAGGHLEWAPEPSVVCDGAALQAGLRVRLAAGAGAVLREIAVLGRHGQRGGRYRADVTVDVGEHRLLAHRTVLDGADPELCGPAGTAGARSVGTLVLAGAAATAGRCSDTGDEPGLRWAWTELAGAGWMLLAVGEPRAVVELLDTAIVACRRPAQPACDHP